MKYIQRQSKNVVEHRRVFIGLKGFDYNTLAPETINFIPPENVIAQWRKDYETMRETMIFGKPLPFVPSILRAIFALCCDMAQCFRIFAKI